MKLAPSINRPELRAVLKCLSRYRRREVRRSLWACLICLSLTSGFISTGVSAKVTKKAVKPKVVKPTVTGIQFEKLVPASDASNKTIPLSVEISGKGFGKTLSPESVRVTLINKNSSVATRATVKFTSDDKIIVRAEAAVNEDGSSECDVELEINGKVVDTTDFPITVPSTAKAAKQKASSDAKPFEVEFNPIKPSNPRSLSITTKNDEPEFAPEANQMKVAILPAGATGITIDPNVSPQKIFVSFTAPDDFEVKDVLVTVYDSSKNLIAYSGNPPPEKDGDGNPIAKEKPPKNDVTITSVDILSLQRRDGFDRLKIEGTGFQNYGARSGEGELELLCNPKNRAYWAQERSDTPSKKNARDLLCPTFNVGQKGTDSQKADKDAQPNPNWRDNAESAVNVTLVPRNPDLRVERTRILYIDDKMIDVYFEFSHWKDFSEPFRLESITVTVNKEDGAVSADAKSAHASSGTSKKSPRTYLASHIIGPPKDKNLEYRYTVLDTDDASELFGFGVGKNFYVLQLSVVNNGDKKLVVPLSSIQAEVEWSYGEDNPNPGVRTIYYDEGPPTLSPLKLSAITSYFDTFQKTRGKKARLFNILDGVGTLAASLVPVFGRGLERGNSIMSGGLIPGLHKAFGDLSSQQLQNLTSMSWDSIEEIPAGGSKEKYVFIQRGDQVFENKSKDNKVVQIRKQIKSLQGLEVSGFIVNDSRPAGATKQQ